MTGCLPQFEPLGFLPDERLTTANLRTSTKILDFRGFDSSILILRGGIPRSKGNSPESLSQGILVGII